MTKRESLECYADLTVDGQQGDLVPDILSLPVLGTGGEFRSMPTEFGVCIVSQTCDVVGSRPQVLVAAVTELSGSAAKEAKSGRTPGRLWIQDRGNVSLFADLDRVAMVDKDLVSSFGFVRGIPQNDMRAMRTFAFGISRKFGRAALPDAVVAVLQPLRKKVIDKARKMNSPWGNVLRDVAEVRVGGWEEHEIRLLFVLQAGVLSPLEQLGDFDPVSVSSVSEIVDQLSRAEGLAREQYWYQLASAIADWLQNSPSAERFTVVVDLFDEDELTLAQARDFDVLDFEHLSGPLP